MTVVVIAINNYRNELEIIKAITSLLQHCTTHVLIFVIISPYMFSVVGSSAGRCKMNWTLHSALVCEMYLKSHQVKVLVSKDV